MMIFAYIFLGILQGVTEPIPVSSSGHVLIFQVIIEKFIPNIDIDFLTLATITNLGSLLAIIFIYRKQIAGILKGSLDYLTEKKSAKKDKTAFSYLLKLIIATIPAGIVGLIVTKLGLFDMLENNIRFIGCMLLVTALFLYLIKDFEGKKEKDKITVKDAIIIGLAQMVSIIPGISRSGATIVGGMYRGLKRTAAFDFSFMLYIPISLATSLLGIKDLLDIGISAGTWIFYIIAMILAAIFTYFATFWFRKIVKEGKLIYFTIYCTILGLVVMLLG